jgi:hypothetical protein
MIPDEIARCGEEQERISAEMQANPSEGAKRGIEDWIAEEAVLRANPSEVAAGLGIPVEMLRHDLERTSYSAAAADRDRYERALRAIAASTLTGVDFGDWVQAVCEDVLAGGEVELSEEEGDAAEATA